MLKVPRELNKNWDAHINFLSFSGILMHCTERRYMHEKITILGIVNLPCLGYNTDKRSILMHIYWCLKREFMN